MPFAFCRTCQEDVAFDEIDGLYYCSQCYCQSEAMRVMEYSQLDSYSQPSQSFGIRSRVIKVTPASKNQTAAEEIDVTEESPEDGGWWLAEVFQMILKAQVDALIKMGVTQKLTEVIKDLWFRYLQKSKWAFLTKQSRRLKEKNDKPEKGEGNETKERNVEEDKMDVTWNKNKNVPLDGELVKKLKFRLQHLLGILYAALRCLEEPIILTDLIRWALDGDLPYYGTSDIIPNHLTNKFSYSESHTFLVAKPDMLHFSRLREPVCHVLDVLDIPAFDSIQLGLTINRFILSLHLPASFHQLTGHLTRRYPFTIKKSKKNIKKKEKFVFEEGPSLAYIIVAIKLLFGLDDETEKVTSEIGRVIRDKLPKGKNVSLFIWDEWMASEKLRAKHHQINTKLVNPQASRQVSDVSRFIKQHTKAFLLDSKRESLNESKKYQGQSLGGEMQRPFMKLRDEDERRVAGPSSFPYTMVGYNEGSEERGVPYSRPSRGDAPLHAASDVRWISKRELASFDFSKSSIDYLLNLNKFCKKVRVNPRSVLNDRRLKKKMVVEKTGEEKVGSAAAGVSQKRKRSKDGKFAAGGKLLPSITEEDHAATVVAEGPSEKVRTKKRKTKKEDDLASTTGQRKTACDVGQSSSAHTDQEELPYEQWKEMILLRSSKVDSSSVTRCVSDTTLQSYSTSYVRYKSLSVHQHKASMERDGEPSSWRPFHQSYQWLLEHCAALYGLEWYYIHEAVVIIETQIFGLKDS